LAEGSLWQSSTWPQYCLPIGDGLQQRNQECREGSQPRLTCNSPHTPAMVQRVSKIMEDRCVTPDESQHETGLWVLQQFMQ
jgi:hypothetical protein